MCTEKLKNGFLLSAGLLLLACAAAATSSAQSPAPAPAEPTTTVTSTVEFGYRFRSVNGDLDKYRSDLNYRAGGRMADSSFLIETKDKFFDSALITANGWGADPSGYFGLNMDKTGLYKFDAKVRNVTYYNNLKNHAFNWSRPNQGSEHRFNTDHKLGDFDLTLGPVSKNFHGHIGYSFNYTNGPGSYTIRFPQFSSATTTTRGDEFEVNSQFKSRSDDLRLGVDGRVLGFDLGFNYGRRFFKDRRVFSVDNFNPGNNPDPTSASITTFQRSYPTNGTTDYLNFTGHRTFAKKLDLTSRVIYSESNSTVSESDRGVGTSSASGTTAPRIFVDLDQISVSGTSKRIQTRADLGVTYLVTEKFRLSNSFNFDQFHISGGNRFFESLVSRNLAGAARPNDVSISGSFRATSYRRFTNTIEGDYQVSKRLGFHLGYRFSKRRVDLGVIDRNLGTGALTLLENEEFENTTHTFLAGTKFTPVRNWTVYMDFDRGQSDNVFTRLANADFVNFRVRTRYSMKQFSLNASFMTRDNDNPGTSEPILGTGGVVIFPPNQTVANSKSRAFSSNVEWTPLPEFTLSTGYTYNKMDSRVDVIVPVGSPIVSATSFRLGKSRYFSRDSFFYFDVNAKPFKRVSLYASYRINDDPGQGNRVEPRPEDIFTSYPLRYQTPEVRLSFKLSKNIDWNLGYQYYSYRESPVFNPFGFIVITGVPNTNYRQAAQNYTAHLPYASLRIYFGKGAADR